jgi:Restriction endonuclease
MQAAAVSSIPANENAPAIRLDLCITDPEVAHELGQHEEGPARDGFASQALRIGVLALRQASGALDAQSIQREGERLLGAVRDTLCTHTSQTTSSIARLLGGYLDPATGSLPQRLERLTKRDGEIEQLLAKHLDGDRSTIAATLARQVGQDSALFKLLSPQQADGLIATLSRAIGEALKQQRDEVLREFSRDRPDSALSRLVADIAGVHGKLRGDIAGDIAAVTTALSLENETGPLARFVARVEKAQRSILDQFSLDQEGSAIRRLSSNLDETRATVARSLTLDDPTSPLSLLRKELMDAVGAFGEANARFQSDVRATLATFRVRREEAARSSLHGHSFEYAAGELLQLEAERAGDLCTRLSGTPGQEGRKTGDFVITLGPESAAPGAKITLECKAERGYTEAQALAELALARKNRGAQVGVFVVARESARDGFSTFRRIGRDVLVVWDADDPSTDVYLKAALSVARALVVTEHDESERSAADVRELEEGVRAIERLVVTVEGIAHDAQLIVKRGTKIGKAAAGLRERLEDEIQRLRGVVEGLTVPRGEVAGTAR